MPDFEKEEVEDCNPQGCTLGEGKNIVREKNMDVTSLDIRLLSGWMLIRFFLFLFEGSDLNA